MALEDLVTSASIYGKGITPAYGTCLYFYQISINEIFKPNFCKFNLLFRVMFVTLMHFDHCRCSKLHLSVYHSHATELRCIKLDDKAML